MPACPVCGITVEQSELQTHVNLCLDGGGGGGGEFAPPPPPPAYPGGAGGDSFSAGKRNRVDGFEDVINVDDDDEGSIINRGGGSTSVTTGGAEQRKATEDLIPCPMCSNTFPASQIEAHASRCDGTGSDEPKFSCPLCKKSALPLSICFRMDECGHPFCRECITKFANDQIYVAVTLKCPTDGCKAAFSIRDTEMLLPELSKSKSAAERKRVAPKKLNPTKRLMEEFKALKETGKKNGFDVELVDDNLFQWHAYFFNFDPKDEPIANDLKKTGGGKLTFLIDFPQDYPLRPPSVRLLRPRLQHMTGHVTIGGSVCFEMLTSQGWQVQFTVESLLVSIRANLIAGGARVDHRNKNDYTEAEAKDAFDRMLRVHGWTNN